MSDEGQFESIPRHVGIIMDGNGRWAKKRGKSRTAGHREGVKSVRASVRFARTHGIESLTLFAFSSENWTRPEQEVSVLMELFMLVLKSEVKTLHKNNVRLKVVGDTTKFSEKLQKKIKEAETLTEKNDALVLNIAANYGGRWDIVDAANQSVRWLMKQNLDPASMTEEHITQFIAMNDQAELDLLIRTGGECRISNFLLWQAAYAELYFTDTLWPDFDEDSFAEAVKEFGARERRFGMTGDQVKQSSEKI